MKTTRKLSQVPRAAPSLLETSIVIRRERGDYGVHILRQFIAETGIQVAAFTESDAEIATEAYRRIGKGSGHPAQLNILDTCAYALAIRLQQPLLFKGNDFTRTDVPSVLVP